MRIKFIVWSLSCAAKFKPLDVERTQQRSQLVLTKMWPSKLMAYSALVVVLVNIEVGIIFYVVIVIQQLYTCINTGSKAAGQLATKAIFDTSLSCDTTRISLHQLTH